MNNGQIALYATTGKRQEKHLLVLYIAVDKDWTSRNLERNGNTGYALAMAPMTPEAWKYRNESTRARSLQYSGSGRATADGMREDLRSLGFDDETVERFAIAAAPYWSNTGRHLRPEQKEGE